MTMFPKVSTRVASRGMRGARPAAPRQGGLALVLALWLVVLLAVVGGSHAYNARIESQLAFNQVETARARALAEAGVNRAVMDLLATSRPEAWQPNGEPHRFAFAGGEVEVSIRNAAGLVDLNTASAEVLDTLLATLALEPGAGEALRDALLDWRDGDDLKRLHGAEDRDYRAAGAFYEARDGELASVEELRYVLGMDNALLRRLLPLVTVYSRQKGVNPKFAPLDLLVAMPGADAEQAADYVAGRGADDPSTPAVSFHNAAGKQLVNATSRAYHVLARASRPAGIVFALEAVVQVERGREQPYTILSWREAVATPAREEQTVGEE